MPIIMYLTNGNFCECYGNHTALKFDFHSATICNCDGIIHTISMRSSPLYPFKNYDIPINLNLTPLHFIEKLNNNIRVFGKFSINTNDGLYTCAYFIMEQYKSHEYVPLQQNDFTNSDHFKINYI